MHFGVVGKSPGFSEERRWVTIERLEFVEVVGVVVVGLIKRFIRNGLGLESVVIRGRSPELVSSGWETGEFCLLVRVNAGNLRWT